MKTDTPETDGEWNRLACQDHSEFERNMADFARKLERERDKARKWSSTLADAGDEIRAQLREEQQLHTQTLNERDEARDQRTKAVEKYQSAVKEMHEAGMHRDRLDDQLDQTILRLGETQERMIDAERQRDRLAEALNAILNDDPDSPLYKIKEAQDALAAWKEARGES